MHAAAARPAAAGEGGAAVAVAVAASGTHARRPPSLRTTCSSRPANTICFTLPARIAATSPLRARVAAGRWERAAAATRSATRPRPPLPRARAGRRDANARIRSITRRRRECGSAMSLEWAWRPGGFSHAVATGAADTVGGSQRVHTTACTAAASQCLGAAHSLSSPPQLWYHLLLPGRPGDDVVDAEQHTGGLDGGLQGLHLDLVRVPHAGLAHVDQLPLHAVHAPEALASGVLGLRRSAVPQVTRPVRLRARRRRGRAGGDAHAAR